VGRAINPMIVEGQILGGAAQGLGYALSEGFYFDQRTGTALNQWFLDLRTPSILDLPDIEPVMVELGEPTHPFGAKGCSEISYVGVAPASPTRSTTPPARGYRAADDSRRNS
jgi:xanthine dehydrogenase molybdenum-binding subunit